MRKAPYESLQTATKFTNSALKLSKPVCGIETQQGVLMYKYLVQCWIRPTSGFDLARKQRIMDMFRELMQVTFPGDEALDTKVEEFNKEHEGLILEPIVLESDKEVNSCEKELMPEIWKKYPEAKLLSCEKIPELR